VSEEKNTGFNEERVVCICLRLSEQVLKIWNECEDGKKKTDTRRVCGYGSHKNHDIGLNQNTYLGAPPIEDLYMSVGVMKD
jgi:hypothetical protein